MTDSAKFDNPFQDLRKSVGDVDTNIFTDSGINHMIPSRQLITPDKGTHHQTPAIPESIDHWSEQSQWDPDTLGALPCPRANQPAQSQGFGHSFEACAASATPACNLHRIPCRNAIKSSRFFSKSTKIAGHQTQTNNF
jgi:hypothetical protein